MTIILKKPDFHLTINSSQVSDLKIAKKISDELIETTNSVDSYLNLWLGMSAPQIGYNKRIILLRESYANYLIMVNPEIVDKKYLLPAFAACYSVPGIYIKMRHYWIRVIYQGLDGKKHQQIFTFGKACVIQHEINHLNGELL